MQLISQMNDKHVLSCIMLNNMTVLVISHSRMFLKMGKLIIESPMQEDMPH